IKNQFWYANFENGEAARGTGAEDAGDAGPAVIASLRLRARCSCSSAVSVSDHRGSVAVCLRPWIPVPIAWLFEGIRGTIQWFGSNAGCGARLQQLLSALRQAHGSR